MTKWNHTTDLLVVGSGGGGMMSALVASLKGLRSIIIEKTEYYGGSTALSGGGVWLPAQVEDESFPLFVLQNILLEKARAFV